MQVCERSERSLPSPIATPLSSPLPLSPGPQGLQATRGPGLVDPMGEETYEGVALQSPLNPRMPDCYFAEPCGWCFPQRVDQALSAVAVTARETKRLMDAHVRFGHRNFRSLAKALNMRMPSKIPFCQACVEAKSTRHPKSITPRPLREPAPRPGYRLHFDPFGPFPERLADGSF